MRPGRKEEATNGRQQIRMKISEVRPQFVNASLAPLSEGTDTTEVQPSGDEPGAGKKLTAERESVCHGWAFLATTASAAQTVRTRRGLRRISIQRPRRFARTLFALFGSWLVKLVNWGEVLWIGIAVYADALNIHFLGHITELLSTLFSASRSFCGHGKRWVIAVLLLMKSTLKKKKGKKTSFIFMNLN